MCIGKQMVHSSILNRVKYYNSELQNAIQVGPTCGFPLIRRKDQNELNSGVLEIMNYNVNLIQFYF